MDGNQLAIGYFLSGFNGAFPGIALNLQPEFLAQPDGTPPSDFYFLNTGPVVLALKLLEISDHAFFNEIGWYDILQPHVLHPFLTPGTPVGHIATFSPSPAYGLYIRTWPDIVFRTQSSLNTGFHQGYQQFVVFRHLDRYYLGFEDLPWWKRGMEGAGDFNDMVLSLYTAPSGPGDVEIPEPSSLSLFAAGALLGALWFRFRTRRAPRA